MTSASQQQPGGPSRAERVLATAAEVAPRPLDAAGWSAVVQRATAPRRDLRMVPAFLVSVLLGVGLVVLTRQSEPPAPPAAPLVVSAGARWSRASDGAIRLDSGKVTVPRGSTVRLDTPDVHLSATRAAFLAEVIAGQTRVWVEEGEVEVRTAHGRRVLTAGEELSWPELPNTLVDAAAAHSERCQGSAARLDCLQAEARGDSLDAQAALYELGLERARRGDVDGAVASWNSSLARFPEGVLQPEVRLALFVELLKARRLDDARMVGRDFQRCCAEDPRAHDVRQVLEALDR